MRNDRVPVTLFLGSGFSVGFGLPTTKQLQERLLSVPGKARDVLRWERFISAQLKTPASAGTRPIQQSSSDLSTSTSSRSFGSISLSNPIFKQSDLRRSSSDALSFQQVRLEDHARDCRTVRRVNSSLSNSCMANQPNYQTGPCVSSQ